ncbi:ninjurin-2-like [Ruditapes philippinarum]|uniref:ninjurin-2-like n=1 Tax=Ruditapes philippinarum TaxID=129788 RepID=UPI00295B22F6|nr:ninjurin-2-like [Ruditapes philippinarum]
MSHQNNLVFSDSALNENIKDFGLKADTDNYGDDQGDGKHERSAIVAMEDEFDGELKDEPDKNVPQNAYVMKRNFIHKLMDVALLMANVSQLKALVASGNNQYYYLLLTFICMSIGLQLVFTICMLVISAIEKTLEEYHQQECLQESTSPKMEKKKWLADMLDRASSVLVLFIIVSNVFIAGFGVESQGPNQ